LGQRNESSDRRKLRKRAAPGGPRLPFGDQKHAHQYQGLRAIPRPILDKYVDEILRGGSSVRRILDVGAGTGQFTIAFASALPDALVESLEPARPMFEELAKQVRLSKLLNVTLRPAALEGFKPESRFDLLVLSEVVHLFADPLALVDRLVGLLRPQGTIAFRTSSQAQLRTRDWYRFFPRARLVDMVRHPPLELLAEALTQQGFLVSETILDESRRMPTRHFLEMIRHRAFSTLYLISDDEFQTGYLRLSAETQGSTDYHYDYRMTLLAARR
jgi:2-polyprenyl-3-methyl-5-hydroxy-6-metoxy-1,4-benzoquinol methylase